MKRIIHVFGSMGLGGAETRTMEIFRNIDRSRVMFDFLVMGEKEGYYDQEIKNLGGNIIRVSILREVGLFRYISEIVTALKSNGPYYAIHSHISFHSGILVLTAFIAGIKVRITHSRTANEINKKGFFRKIYFVIMRSLINLFTTKKVACGSDAGKFLYGERYVKENKVKIIYNAIDIEEYKNLNFRNIKLRTELGLKKSDLLIGHIGSFKKVKNHKFIVSIIEELKKQNIKFKFLFIGDGKLRKNIENLINILELEEYVLFLGIRNDIPEIMSMLDMLLLPSFYEGLPGVVIEAQAAGTPSIVSEEVTKEVDVGLKIVHYLPINNIDLWILNIIEKSYKLKIDYNDIYECFKQKGFTVTKSIEELYSIYNIEA